MDAMDFSLIIELSEEGSCGDVYTVMETRTGLVAALKIEDNGMKDRGALKQEIKVLNKLKGKAHICQPFESGQYKHFSYMITTLLGPSLAHLLKKCDYQLSFSTQIRTGINVLYGLKQIHDTGFVHRDIKPVNLAIGQVGTPASRFIHILNFGLSREYVQGTTRYCSLNTHDTGKQGRVDDLWSLLYLMTEMRGQLPWHKYRDKEEVAAVKRLAPDTILLYLCPVQFLDFVRHLRELSYSSRPDYKLLFDLLNDVMNDGEFSFADPFDWEEKGFVPKPNAKPEEKVDKADKADKDEKAAPSREVAEDDGGGRSPVHSNRSATKGNSDANAADRKSGTDKDTPGGVPTIVAPVAPVNHGDPNNPFPAEDFA